MSVHFRNRVLMFVVLACLLGGANLATAAPRNVIYFIGDGMGFEQAKAGRCYVGQPLAFESFPYSGQLQTYSYNSSVTDSAAAGTALATGIKVNNGVISMAYPGDGSELTTLLELYKVSGKSVGLVTTTYMTHATPATFGAHEPSRNNLSQIAFDYMNQTLPHVLLGGGGNGMSISTAQSSGYTVVTNASDLLSLDTETATMVSGQFGTTDLPYEYDGMGVYPHLSEMTLSALEVLDNNPNGFFLMVEGGKIDHACHSNDLPRATLEVVEFNNAVQEAIAWAAGRTDTLILIVADHETGGLTVTADNGAGVYPSGTWSSTGHTGVDVPAFAWGENAHLISGVMDNTYMFTVVMATKAGGAVPADGATEVSTNPVLEWAVSPLAASYDVYFGTTYDAVLNATPISPEFKGNQTGATFLPGELLPSTTYFWSIDVVDSRGGTMPGDVWSFTTQESGPVNNPPTAVDDSVNTSEDTPATFNALANDTDPEGDLLAVFSYTQPAHGSVVLNPDNTFTYTPAADFNGTDSFTYVAKEAAGTNKSNQATVTLDVAAVNDAPEATGDSYDAAQDGVLSVAAPGVLANDTDVDSANLSAVLAAGAANGSVVLNADGSFVYTPTPGFLGADSFTYRASDGALESNEATVAIEVMPVNYDAIVSQEPIVYLGTLAGDGIAGTMAPNDGLVQTITEASVGPAMFRLDVEYVLHTIANKAEVTQVELFIQKDWSPIEGPDPLVVLIWNGVVWLDITSSVAEGVFTESVAAASLVDSDGNIRVRFQDTKAFKKEIKTTLTIDYLYAKVTTGLPDLTPPAAPTELAAVPGNGYVDLDWADQAEPDLTGYHVYRALGSAGPYERITTTPLIASACRDSGLPNDETYYYKVAAIDMSGNESALSAYVEATPVTPPPGSEPLMVASIGEMGLQKAGKNYAATAPVGVVDDLGYAVSGATISGEWEYPNGALESATGLTDAAGHATFTSSNYKAATGEAFTFRVINVTATGYRYDATQVVTESILVP